MTATITMTDDALRTALRAAITDLRENVVAIARLVAEAERRGIDVSAEVPIDLSPLRKIARGTLSPAAWSRFAGSAVLVPVSSLPIPKQEALAAGESVPLLVMPYGERDHIDAKPLDLTREQIAQVFGRGEVRTLAQQRLYIEAQRAKVEKAAADGVSVGDVVIPRALYDKLRARARRAKVEPREWIVIALAEVLGS